MSQIFLTAASRKVSDVQINIKWQDILILMYHDIYKSSREPKYDHFYVLESVFAHQMDALIKDGYQPVTLKSAINSVQSHTPLPKKSFAVTFDDGYSSFFELAAPILESRHIPATVFLVSELVGTKNSWVEKDGFESDPLMTWQQIHELQRTSSLFDFQAHTANHVRLADISLETANLELMLCKENLEQKLGTHVDSICYPWGSVNDDVIKAASDLGYTSGLTTEFGRLTPYENLMRLPRIAMHHVPSFSLKFGPRWPNFWWRIKTRKDKRSI
jgi:peptidoglycan/xylan/chitin deacetylase (PgdA/CDA1 family)